MSDKSSVPDAVDTFQKMKARQAAQTELDEKKWTLDEIRELEAKAEGDNERQLELLALRPYFERSNMRGDFRYEHQMSRTEAKEHLQSRGIEGEPWSLAELTAITCDRECYVEYRDAIEAARLEGRIMFNQADGMKQDGRYHFGGEGHTDEGFEMFKKNLNAKLERLTMNNEAQALVTETMEKHAEMIGADIDGRERFSYLKRQIAEINKHDHKLYPVERIPGAAELSRTLEELTETLQAEGKLEPASMRR